MAAIAQKQAVRVRIAPSPTGPLHIGTARTALFVWLFARQSEGVFVLRIEDTDRTRSEKQYEVQIFEGLEWLGLAWDEGPDPKDGKDKGSYGPYRQSERIHIYREHLDKLLNDRKAYFCYCTKEELESERQFLLSQGLPPKYSGHCRNLESRPLGKDPQVIRFKTPETKVEFKDLIHGKVSFDAGLFGDIVISRVEKNSGNISQDTWEFLPLFHFAVVVDDALMKITHVIRGEDHLSNTPKQILLFHALGFDPPLYGHIPLILNPDRSKMSKRFSDTTLLDYRKRGYLSDALVNFLALLGWHPQDDRELLTLEELIKEFDIARVQKAGAIFNQDKLDWLNREYVKRMDDDAFFAYAKSLLGERGDAVDQKLLRTILDAERNRIKDFSIFWDQCSFFFTLPDYPAALLSGPSQIKNVGAILNESKETLQMIPDISWRKEHIRTYLEKISEREGRGSVYWPFRVALSGQNYSPDPLEISEILGKEESLERIQRAIQKLNE